MRQKLKRLKSWRPSKKTFEASLGNDGGMKNHLPVFCLGLVLLASCSINKMVMNKVSDVLSGSGGNEVFTGDSDPELVGDALPFALKMYETLLSQNPGHQGLILTTGSLFIMYANAFVQGPAEMLPPEAYLEKKDQLERARKLYLRGTEIIEGGLEKKFPGWTEARAGSGFSEQLAKITGEDIPYIYWDAAGILSAYALNPFDLDLGMRIPEITALLARSYEIDPDYNSGALDDFYLLFYASLPEGMGGDRARAELHYRRALEKSQGRSAGTYVSYARTVAVPNQDYETFKSCLEAALAIDIDADTSNRLQNILSQRQARYLLENASNFFADLETEIFSD
jgi:predicted anti-sigma-YlaC factor YlaD